MKNKTQNAFTLIELLIVVSIMSILLTVGTPNLFRAAKRYRYEQNYIQFQAMINEMRSAAINNRVIPGAAAQHQKDTNFDGTNDDRPFAYVFEIDHLAGVFRTYADFSGSGAIDTYEADISATTGYDELISEYNMQPNFNMIYAVRNELASQNTNYDFSQNTAPNNLVIGFAFLPPFGEVEMYELNPSSSSDATPVNAFITATLRATQFDRSSGMFIYKNSGIPYFVTY